MLIRTIGIALAATVLMSTPSYAQAADDVWQDKCSACHGKLNHFAAQNLFLQQDIAVLRRDREELRLFLSGHGRLNSAEIDTLVGGVTELLRALQPR